MLADLRKALADTIQAGIPTARVVPYEPLKIDMPQSGVFIYIRPSSTETFLQRWSTLDPSIWVQVYYDAVILVPDNGAERAHQMLDDLIDPLLTTANVFAAVRADVTLGVTSFTVNAQPLFESVVVAYERVQFADGATTYWQAVFPISCNVNSIGA